MVNDLIVTYAIYRVGNYIFWPVFIFVAVLLFHPVGWLIIGVIWFLGQMYKGVEEQVAEEDAQARCNAPDASTPTPH